MYRLIRPALFALDAERAHDAALRAAARAAENRLVLAGVRRAYAARDARLEVRAMGRRFPNPVGLAAGLDKRAAAVPFFEALGFGGVEVGTVTAEPQGGNPRPRVFRLPADEAIVNRMGFNNEGAAAAAARLEAVRPRVGIPVGVNVGKSRSAPLESAAEDYERALRAVWHVADYLVLNVSSPNTPGLRALQGVGPLTELLRLTSRLRGALGAKAIALKVSPDEPEAQLERIAATAERHGLDALVATNTTLARTGLMSDPREEGGLSGRPLAPRSHESLRVLARCSTLPIVSVGGIFDAADVLGRLRDGAAMVQIYTALVYRGPGLVARILRDLGRACDRAGAASIGDLAAAARETSLDSLLGAQ